MALMDGAAVSYALVLTKRDEVKASDANARRESVLSTLRVHPAAYPEVFFTSARTGEGVADLRGHIARLLRERVGNPPAPP